MSSSPSSSSSSEPVEASMAPLQADGTPQRFFGPDVERSRLRAAVVALGAEIQRVGLTRGDEPTTLSLHYETLVRLLGLGAEPEVRACPVCGTIGMRRATVCGNCWSPLAIPA